jgi:hemoglobin
MSSVWQPGPQSSAFDAIGGADAVKALAEEFYEQMYRHEPALTRLHRCGEDGRVGVEQRERFGLFLIGWLGGPQDYAQRHGHPRLRMRHGGVPVDKAMGEAWVRCMNAAMEARGLAPEVQAFLRPRFAQTAEFLRNVPESV